LFQVKNKTKDLMQSTNKSSSSTSSKGDWWKPFAAGNVGGIFGLSLAYPLDTVKVRMQTRAAGTYKGIAHCIMTMGRNEGPLSLYRGLLAPIVGYGFINATAFGSYTHLKQWIREYGWNEDRRSERNLSLAELGICGVGAGFIQSFVRAPIEQIKVLMQARNSKSSIHHPPYKSSLHCLTETLKNEGIKVGLYRGLNATIIREMPQYGIYYPTYEICKRAFCKPGEDVSKLPPLWTALAGGISGVAQWVPTYSFDVVKSHIHAAEPGTYKSFMECAKILYNKDGIAIFFRGFSACIARAFPLHGAVFLGYEMTMRFLQ